MKYYIIYFLLFLIVYISFNFWINNNLLIRENFDVTILSDPRERKTLNFINKIVFYTPYLIYYPLSISTASKEGSTENRKKFESLNKEWSQFPLADPMDNNIEKDNSC